MGARAHQHVSDITLTRKKERRNEGRNGKPWVDTQKGVIKVGFRGKKRWRPRSRIVIVMGERGGEGEKDDGEESRTPGETSSEFLSMH